MPSSYVSDMRKSRMSAVVTLRISAAAVQRLQRRARARGVTTSALIRDLVEHEAGSADGDPSAFDLTEKWVGAVRSRAVPAGRTARRALAGWQPDRRG
jgi:hypothetical protein